MNLLANEQTILTSNENRVTLTNLRLNISTKEWKNTIFLEDISSIEVRSKSNFIFLTLGILVLLFAVGLTINGTTENSSANWLAYPISLLMFFLYFRTKENIISITPNGGKAIHISVRKINNEQTEDFIEKIQVAKVERLKEIYKL